MKKDMIASCPLNSTCHKEKNKKIRCAFDSEITDHFFLTGGSEGLR